jgi:hypothetical protein
MEKKKEIVLRFDMNRLSLAQKLFIKEVFMRDEFFINFPEYKIIIDNV